VEALAADGLEERLASLLVVPGAVGGTGLHGRQDVDEAGMATPLDEHLLDTLLFTKLGLADELDGDVVFSGQSFSVLPKLIAQLLSPPRVVEDADPPSVEVSGHPLGVAQLRQGTLDDHAVEAGKHPTNLVEVAANE
jgi:hypothetical protein